MRAILKAALTSAMIVVLCGPVIAAGPTMTTVQGKLTDGTGNPVTAGQYKLIFKLFDQPTAGREIWPIVASEELHVVTVGNDGLWTVNIGSTHPLDSDNLFLTDVWLEVSVEGPSGAAEILPRVQLTTEPYAHRITTVDDATGGDIFGDILLHSSLIVGDVGDQGAIEVKNSTGTTQVDIDGQTGDVDATGAFQVYSTIGGTRRALLGNGLVYTYASDGTTLTSQTFASASGGGASYLYQEDGDIGTYLDGDDGNSGRMYIRNAANANTVTIDGDDGTGGGTMALTDGTNTTVWFDGNGGEGGGGCLMYNSAGVNTVEIDADEGDVGVFRLFNEAGATRVRLHATAASSGGEIQLLDEDGTSTVYIQGSEGTANGGQIVLKKSDGTTTITLDAEYGTGGTGRITVPVVEITGGSDLSEQFEIRAAEGVAPMPGMVVSLDPNNPGNLLVSSKSYDRTVAGIVSGAGGVNPGMLMSQSGTKADGTYPVALTGRVYVWANNSQGNIQVGDLLTTSDTPGYAMKVSDHSAAQGAIIGKAMTPLTEAEGLILALVSLQ